ncbi:MAG: hypothetical protein ABI892_11090, partial [Flavobacterium sp.]
MDTNIKKENFTYQMKISNLENHKCFRIKLANFQVPIVSLLFTKRMNCLLLIVFCLFLNSCQDKKTEEAAHEEEKSETEVKLTEVQYKTVGIETGSVGPLCVLNDTEGQAVFVLDKRLADVSIWYMYT